MKKVIICLFGIAVLMLAQWSDFSSLTSSKNLSNAMNSKPAIRSGTAVPSANCTTGKDLYVQTSVSVLYGCGPTNNTWFAIGASAVWQTTVTHITAAQIWALNATPITLVPAQGANTQILVDNISYEVQMTSADAFDCSPESSNWDVRWNDQPQSYLSEMDQLLKRSDRTFRPVVPTYSLTAGSANQPLLLLMPSGSCTADVGTGSVWITTIWASVTAH